MPHDGLGSRIGGIREFRNPGAALAVDTEKCVPVALSKFQALGDKPFGDRCRTGTRQAIQHLA